MTNEVWKKSLRLEERDILRGRSRIGGMEGVAGMEGEKTAQIASTVRRSASHHKNSFCFFLLSSSSLLPYSLSLFSLPYFLFTLSPSFFPF